MSRKNKEIKKAQPPAAEAEKAPEGKNAESRFKEAFRLFGIFFKIGAFTFGGGHAMIPLIKREICEKRKYLEEEKLLDMVAVCESTPGPVAVNMATYIGFKRAGFFGAALATFGVVLPSFAIILLISAFYNQFTKIEAVRFAFNGIRIAVLVLIANALISLFKQCNKGILPYIIMALSFIAVAIFKFNVFIVIAAGALIGLASMLIADFIRKKNGRAGSNNNKETVESNSSESNKDNKENKDSKKEKEEKDKEDKKARQIKDEKGGAAE